MHLLRRHILHARRVRFREILMSGLGTTQPPTFATGMPESGRLPDHPRDGLDMPRNIYCALYVLTMVASIVSVDLLFLRNQFTARLLVNIAIVLAFAVFYFLFLKKP